MSESNKQVVRRFIEEGLGNADPDAAAQCLAPGATSELMAAEPMGIVVEREDFLRTIGHFRKMVPGGLNPRITDIHADGDHVIVEWQGNGVSIEGTPYANRYCMVCRLENGRIKTIKEYLCTMLAGRVLGALHQALEEEEKP